MNALDELAQHLCGGDPLDARGPGLLDVGFDQQHQGLVHFTYTEQPQHKIWW